jgi:ABC-type sugar transport system substrate-binding protein
MTRFRSVVFALAALAAAPASAADAVFPPGSRIGIVPPAGTVASKNFFGFEDAEKQVAIVLVTLPPEAYADLDKTVGADSLKRQGLTLESREALTLPTGKAFLAIGRAAVDKVKMRRRSRRW